MELPNTVEGMIRLADMHDDYYIYDEEHYLLTGEHTKRTYKLGEAVVIRVEDTDKLMRTINFSIVGRANRIEE
ncbi:S1 RNA-binding domain-containing protein [Lachnoclostridium sp.]|uniref:S1 RNA-binding domain-containing protein n=1 Tax=Lachnoclostridium sp. TaxID=2028282 RepID=UPI0028979219|nr:S1 RNA-binding domain-containing protein [Lachnoclostridium sp.]